jgi:GINS complex subunit 4
MWQINYLRQYGELVEKHYRRTVLNHLPKEAWKKLDEPEMIDSPNLEEFVFCRVLERIQIDIREDNLGEDEDGGGDMIDTIQEHEAGAVLIVMYKSIRELVFDGKVELLM